MSWFATILPDFIVTAAGVLLGGIGALAMARWQLRRQSAEQEERTRRHLEASVDWVELELVENHGLVAELCDVFTRTTAARADLLRWAATIAQAICTDAQADLVRSGLHRQLAADVERELLLAYQRLSALRNRLRQAEPAVNFYVSCCGEDESADRLVRELEDSARTALGALERARATLQAMDQTQRRRRALDVLEQALAQPV